MLYLILLVLVGTCQGLAGYKKHDKPTLPKPNLLGLIALYPSALQVEWELVDDVPGLGPIKGYKVLVWELRPVRVEEYKLVDGFETLMKGFRPPKLSDSDTGTLSEVDAMKIVVSDPRVSKARIPDIKINSIYEVRVRAFTESTDGPLSSHLTVKFLDESHTFGKP